jgi:hypothetical protein
MFLSRIRQAFDGPAVETFAGGSIADRRPATQELRGVPRHEIEIAAKLIVMGAEHDCMIQNISTGGMTVVVRAPNVCMGVQVMVTCAMMPTLCGMVRWFRGDAIGVEFVKSLSVDQVTRMRQMVPAGMQPRAARARIKLPATARFADQCRKVEVLNLSVGGLMMSCGLPPKPGQGLMIEFAEMLPIGGHVRWTEGGRCGVMFSKLLPIAAAEELARRGRIPDGWLDELRWAHGAAGRVQ